MEMDSTLIEKAKQLDEKALEEIFLELKPFIRTMAFKYFLSGADRDDLMQEGMIGL
ncbi:MAG: RNA polymerase sporulation sigma factor SigH, partial [Clostridia bacterium]|nr:RNA polymerase sporulation sigma factor SigH [Clostridia bacterium]